MTHENVFKHQQLQATTQIDLQKLALEGQKVGIDNHVQMSQLASQLMRDQQDSDAADQDSQLKMAGAQNEADATAQAGEQARNAAQLQAAQIASQHMAKMHQLNSSHVQAMTDLASRHHAAMAGHGIEGGADCGRRTELGGGS